MKEKFDKSKYQLLNFEFDRGYKISNMTDVWCDIFAMDVTLKLLKDKKKESYSLIKHFCGTFTIN